MTKFLEALGGKLAERWLALLLGPSLLLMIVTLVGTVLGHRRWHDTALLLSRLNRWSTEPALRNAGTLVLLLAVVLTVSAGLGVAAGALGAAVERLWLARRPRWLARRRQRRWDAAQDAFNRALLEAARAENSPAAAERAQDLNARRNRISIARPVHAFWLGDRITAVDTRLWETYRLDLASVWPRLWLILPEDVRAEITAARARLTAASRLAGWAAGYLAAGVVWWPAAVIAVGTALTARRRARVAAVAFADLTESAVDLHARALAESLGITCEGKLTEDVGAEITTMLRKRT
ncbi:hypothetical protein [Lentzea sp. NBRC 102530]|uniref:hypothetical protein n=1 Tax=Lentzea sp. NBRC 102530 TaxID=3032201 RepID=UPI0024A1307E|nr:hypothetical protein [Lentzea sp. NBRC 102530]GLY47272.1 hypothetical protein Lesp01_09280 [Lentzea sp. NBRC 102530]